MTSFKIVAALALAIPGMAMAQVGPNPAASGGSLDPTVGAARDTMTAPMGNSPSMSTRSNAGMMSNGSTGMTGTSDTTTTTTTTGKTNSTVGAGATVGSDEATSTTSAKATTRAGKTGMGKSRKPR